MMIKKLDISGLACVLSTYILLIYADVVVIKFVILPQLKESLWSIIHIVLFNVLILILVFSHGKSVLTNPGFVDLPLFPLDFSDVMSGDSQPSTPNSENEWTICRKCDIYRPPRSHHCKVCGRCVKKMDHHCPWINNCVGEKNQKYFIRFLFYTAPIT